MSSKTPEEGVKQFLGLILENKLLEKPKEVLKIISGSLLIAREKLQILNEAQATKILPETGLSLHRKLTKSVVDIYQEEAQKAKKILDDIDAKVLELQTILETIEQRLIVDIPKKLEATRERQLIFGRFEDCRSILLFIKLKTKILQNYLEVPPDVNIVSDPFEQCPEFKIDEDKAEILLLKLHLDF